MRVVSNALNPSRKTALPSDVEELSPSRVEPVVPFVAFVSRGSIEPSIRFWLQPPELDQEHICLGHRELEILAAGPSMIEESVALPLPGHDLAVVAGLDGLLAESFGAGQQAISRAEKHDARRLLLGCIGQREQLHERATGPRAFGDHGVIGQSHERVEQHHRVRCWTYPLIIGLRGEVVDQRHTRGQVATRRSTTGGDVVGIDPQVLGVAAHPAHRGLGVLNAVFDLHRVPRRHPVLHGDRDHATGGEVLGMVGELPRAAIPPSAAEEEYDRRRLCVGCVILRLVRVPPQGGVTDLLVCVLLVEIRRLRRIG